VQTLSDCQNDGRRQLSKCFKLTAWHGTGCRCRSPGRAGVAKAHKPRPAGPAPASSRARWRAARRICAKIYETRAISSYMYCTTVYTTTDSGIVRVATCTAYISTTSECHVYTLSMPEGMYYNIESGIIYWHLR